MIKTAYLVNSLKREREGSGLGLSIVKSLVEIHSGSILLKSQLHVGSEFIVTFPKSNCYNEVLPTTDVIEENDIMKSVDIEFSDIYPHQ